MIRKLIKILSRFLLALLLLLLTVWVLVQSPPVQNWLVDHAASRLSKELHADVSVKHVNFSLFKKVLLEGVLIKDQKKDTLLYCERAGLGITNWFFLKEKAVIRDLYLEHTSVYLNRKDSTWNYAFLTDYFSSPSTSKQKKETIELILEKAKLTDVHIIQKDDWRGETMEMRFSYLLLDPKEINFKKKIVRLERLEIETPGFFLSHYKGNRPPKISTPKVHPKTNQDSISLNPDHWVVEADHVFLTDGHFRYDKATERKPFDHFDGLHIGITQLDAHLSHVVIQGDSLVSTIQLTGKERSGFQIDNLEAQWAWNAKAMEFRNLKLQTPKSNLSNYFSMNYADFNEDMSEFITNVTMKGHFSKSQIHTDDIAYFAPELRDWHESIFVNGEVNGTVDHLKGKNVELKVGKESSLEADFIMDGLPEIENTFFDIKSKLFYISYKDAVKIIPLLKKITVPQLSQINYLRFQGNYTGYLNDFVTFGTLQSNLGTIVCDLNLKLPKNQAPVYSGSIQTNGFALGTFLNLPLLGKVAMKGTVKGKGFQFKNAVVALDGTIQEIELNGYNYHSIVLKGNLDHKLITGKLSVNDPNLTLTTSGQVDLGRDTPVYKLTGVLSNSRFKELKLIRQNLDLSCNFDFNFKAKTIDDFTGTAIINNAVLLSNGTPLSFDSLYVSNNLLPDGSKLFLLKSNEIDASIAGQFSLLKLPLLTQSILHNYFPAYFNAPKKEVAFQKLSFQVKSKNISPFINLLGINIKGFDDATIEGNIDVNEKLFNLYTQVPSFEYNNLLFQNVQIEGESDWRKLHLKGTIDKVLFNDSLHLPNTDFTLTASSDTGTLSLRTSASRTIKDANLNASFRAGKTGFTIRFLPSTLMVNEKKWQLEEESELFIGKGIIQSDGIKFTSGKEELLAYTHPSETGNYDDLIIELRKVELGDITPFLFKDPRIEGSITGRIDIQNPLGNYRIEATTTTEKFRFNNDSIGILKLTANYNPETGAINYETSSDNLLHQFNIKGSTTIKDPDNIYTDNWVVIKNEPLSIVQKYLSVIMTDMKGTGNGILRIQGKGTSPEITGSITLNKASFILDYTKCKYTVENGTVLQFKPGAIDFGNIKLSDTNNRTATFKGIMYHRFFDQLSFDLHFKTNDEKRGLLVLNTEKKDNSIFYGKVIAAAEGSISGPVNKMILKLRGVPTDSSKIYLPTSDSRVTGTSDFIVFRKYGSEMKSVSNIKATSSILVDLDVIANPYAKVYLIFDEVTNDVIEGQGRGSFNLRVGTFEKTTMTGNFEITKGLYTLNWQYLITKPFLINKGIINWNGDPYDAQINIDAISTVENVRLPAELARNCNNERNKILVIGNVSGTLKNTNIQFRFELPQGHPCRNNPLTISGLNQLYSNPSEMNKQITSLLLFNSFISGSPNTVAGQGLGNTFISGAAGTISEFISQQVASGLGYVLNSIPGVNKLNLDPYITFNPGLVSGTQAQGYGFQGTGNFGITQRLLNGRIVLKAGGSVLVSAGQTTALQYNNQLTPDISLEWLITPDGKLRIIGFYRSIFDIQRRSDRTGMSFSYVREFDQFQLFGNRKTP